MKQILRDEDYQFTIPPEIVAVLEDTGRAFILVNGKEYIITAVEALQKE